MQTKSAELIPQTHRKYPAIQDIEWDLGHSVGDGEEDIIYLDFEPIGPEIKKPAFITGRQKEVIHQIGHGVIEVSRLTCKGVIWTGYMTLQLAWTALVLCHFSVRLVLSMLTLIGQEMSRNDLSRYRETDYMDIPTGRQPSRESDNRSVNVNVQNNIYVSKSHRGSVNVNVQNNIYIK